MADGMQAEEAACGSTLGPPLAAREATREAILHRVRTQRSPEHYDLLSFPLAPCLRNDTAQEVS